MRNEIKIRFDKPEYEINSEKGVVECFLRYEVLYPESTQDILFFGEKVYFYTKAIAQVNSGDIFDENVGKKISLAKAEQKAYEKVSKHLFRQITNTLTCAFEIASDFIDKAFNVIDHNDKYLEQWK